MTIEAKVVCDSISLDGNRLTTMCLTYPRFIHSELMTHRMLSKNAASSRAITIQKVISDLEQNPALPVYWGKNQKGMQAKAELDPESIEKCKQLWAQHRAYTIGIMKQLDELKLHKQITNRIAETHFHMRTLVSGTDWDNLLGLRYHEDAQPEFLSLAKAMFEAKEESKPKLIENLQWHMPYTEGLDHDLSTLKRRSVARCCRVSYLNHDNSETTLEQDLELFNRLVGSVPRHMSPLEHIATPTFNYPHTYTANFKGWRQYRKEFADENITKFIRPSNI